MAKKLKRLCDLTKEERTTIGKMNCRCKNGAFIFDIPEEVRVGCRINKKLVMGKAKIINYYGYAEITLENGEEYGTNYTIRPSLMGPFLIFEYFSLKDPNNRAKSTLQTLLAEENPLRKAIYGNDVIFNG